MFVSKDCHSVDTFVMTDLKIAENRSIEFSHLDARICVLNSYNSVESKLTQATTFRQLSDSILYFKTLHIIRLDLHLPFKVGWNN